MRLIQFCTWLLMTALLLGCASKGQRAPVFERAEAEKKRAATAEVARKKGQREKDWRPEVYVVQKGDTLYSIAFNYGFDYHELAELNRIMVASVESKPDTKPEAAADDGADEADETGLEWSIPAQGKLIGEFSESANRKGIDIAGTLGQPVFASAPGKVVYSGSGLRGYGKLIIIKHNKTYLSAYAHNDKILVKEGQSVARGQKIAAMGNTDTDKAKLHFEGRRFGKPVDPAKYLPLGKS